MESTFFPTVIIYYLVSLHSPNTDPTLFRPYFIFSISFHFILKIMELVGWDSFTGSDFPFSHHSSLHTYFCVACIIQENGPWNKFHNFCCKTLFCNNISIRTYVIYKWRRSHKSRNSKSNVKIHQNEEVSHTFSLLSHR